MSQGTRISRRSLLAAAPAALAAPYVLRRALTASAKEELPSDRVTVGIIGSAPPFVGDVKGPWVSLPPIADAVGKVLPEVEAKADVIVLLTHVGPPADKKLIHALPRVDIIFGGHHHKRYASLNYDKATRTILQHSGCFGKVLGEVVIEWDGKKIIDRKARLIPITLDLSVDEDVQGVVNTYLPAKAPAARAGR